MVSFLSCKNNSTYDIISIDIEFDVGKEEFYDKYDLCLTISDTKDLNELFQLINQTSNKIACRNTRPVMWEIDVFTKYKNGKSQHLLTLGSSTYNKESLKLQNKGCFDNIQLVSRLKEIMNVESIKNHDGKMRQPEFDELLAEKPKE